MEDTLRALLTLKSKKQWKEVLILVVMEYTLRDAFLNGAFYYGGVLILVLMEDTLRDCVILYILCVLLCLNPCFNGRYSQRHLQRRRS